MYIINPSQMDVFALSTERLTRYKHDFIYPTDILKKYLETRGISPNQISHIYIGLPFESNCIDEISTHHNNKEILFRKILGLQYFNEIKEARKEFRGKNKLKHYKRIFKSNLWPQYIKSGILKNLLPLGNDTIANESAKEIKKVIPNAIITIKCFDHSYAHALSSYYSSPFDNATLITMDGYGDGAFSKAYVIQDGKLRHISKCDYVIETKGYGGSIGEIYSHFTGLLGFQPLADEGKVEALAAYGNHQNQIYKDLIGLVELDTKTHRLTINIEKSEKFFARNNIEQILKKHTKEDISSAVQHFLEDSTIPYFKDIIATTGIDNLCLSGGVAANVIMNLKAFEEVTKNLHIAPAMGDEGTAEGAAIAIMLENGHSHKTLSWTRKFSMPYLGTSYSGDQVKNTLTNNELINHNYLGEDWHHHVAKLLADGKIGGLFQGRMEWGPRALGNRSIIATANNSSTRIKINKEIKRRPEFQPFCPSILVEEKDRLFESSYNNKHMTCAFRMKEEFIEDLPSAVHIDGTARVQFVSNDTNPSYHKLLNEIKQLTGYGVLINTSFNKHGRTIVETPQDAINDFIDTDLDFLIIEGHLVTRT